MIPEFTNYNKLKFFINSELKYSEITKLSIEDLLPNNTKFRNYEIFKIDPFEQLIFGENSLRMRYEKLFICAGLEPDYSQVEGLLYALDDTQSNVFSCYHFEKAVSKMSVFTHCIKNKIINFQKLTQRDINFMEQGFGNIVYSCMGNYKMLKCGMELNNNEKKESLLFSENEKLHNYYLIDEIFSGFMDCVNNIILFYDLIKKYNKTKNRESYINSNNFYITVPYSKEFFMENLSINFDDFTNFNINLLNIGSNDNVIENILENTKEVLTVFLLKELEKRKIKILWGYNIKKITLNNKLIFSNDKEIEYNLFYVSPNLTFPKIFKYGIIDTNINNQEKKKN